MKKVLFIVDSDPRSSPKPAEAMRVAAGLCAWQQVKASLYLHGAAVLAIGRAPGEVIDEEVLRQHAPLLASSSCPVYAERAAALLPSAADSVVPFTPIDGDQLAELIARSDCALRF